MNRKALLLPTALLFGIWIGLNGATAGPAIDTVEFRFPFKQGYHLDAAPQPASISLGNKVWLKAWPAEGGTNLVELGDRVVLQVSSPVDLTGCIAGHPLEVARTLSTNLVVLQAPDALTAAL